MLNKTDIARDVGVSVKAIGDWLRVLEVSGQIILLGSVWETFVFSELRKINADLAEPVNFWYYRDQRAREVDFLIQTGDVLSFIECKWTEKPRQIRTHNT
jgi:predicted AAA+ superfamily ATPase